MFIGLEKDKVNQQRIKTVLNAVVQGRTKRLNLLAQHTQFIHMGKSPIQKADLIPFNILGCRRGQHHARKQSIKPIHQKEIYRALYIQKQNNPVFISAILGEMDKGFIKDYRFTIAPGIFLPVHINVTVIGIRRHQAQVIAQ